MKQTINKEIRRPMPEIKSLPHLQMPVWYFIDEKKEANPTSHTSSPVE